ncbi:MAG TPA: bifunctional 3-phenylpropionate/cinnamic acid dioxygenase ferredoxin subunit [Bacillota bacterium]
MSANGPWHRVAASAEIPEGRGKAFDVGGKRIAVFRVEDEFYAIEDTCSHAEASLAEGEVSDCEVECPRHGARFDLRTGAALSLPAVRPVRTYPVRVEDGQLLVRVDE